MLLLRARRAGGRGRVVQRPCLILRDAACGAFHVKCMFTRSVYSDVHSYASVSSSVQSVHMKTGQLLVFGSLLALFASYTAPPNRPFPMYPQAQPFPAPASCKHIKKNPRELVHGAWWINSKGMSGHLERVKIWSTAGIWFKTFSYSRHYFGSRYEDITPVSSSIYLCE